MSGENDDTNTKTAELLASLIERLSEKEAADEARDESERANAKKVRNLYLGIIASILSIFGASIVQYGAPPKVADKSDIIDILKKRDFRPDPWTGDDDDRRMRENTLDRHREQKDMQRRINDRLHLQRTRLDKIENKVDRHQTQQNAHELLGEHPGARIKMDQLRKDVDINTVRGK